MSSFVLDNSVSAAWCFEDQSTPYTDAVLQAVINGAWVFVVTEAKGTKFLQDLQPFSVTIDTDGLDHVFSTVLAYARAYQRSAYDASYLELAKRRGLPLATRDEPLRKAAEELGIRIFQPEVPA